MYADISLSVQSATSSSTFRKISFTFVKVFQRLTYYTSPTPRYHFASWSISEWIYHLSKTTHMLLCNFSFAWCHCGSVSSTVTSQQQGPWFESGGLTVWSLHVILCWHGFPPSASGSPTIQRYSAVSVNTLMDWPSVQAIPFLQAETCPASQWPYIAQSVQRMDGCSFACCGFYFFYRITSILSSYEELRCKSR